MHVDVWTLVVVVVIVVVIVTDVLGIAFVVFVARLVVRATFGLFGRRLLLNKIENFIIPLPDPNGVESKQVAAEEPSRASFK